MSAATVVSMPRLSDSMEQGTVVHWLKANGEEVQRGDELVEIETDKATMTYEAESSGVLRRLVAEGATIALGGPIAELLVAGQPLEPVSANGRDGRTAASPVARRVAESGGIELAVLTGSGPRGRIVKRDVEAAITRRVAPIPAAEPEVERATGAVETVELTRVQATIARRMVESRATVPDFSVEVDVLADALVALREQMRADAGDGFVPSYNDFVVKACALALREHPRVNGAYRDGRVERHGRVNIGIAVASEDALLVPVVTDVDKRSLGAIARETRRLSGRARDGSLTPTELSGGTFTVSNLGMFGVTRFTAVVNQPQAAILAVGALEQRPVVDAGVLRVGHVMTLTLCADHRILYGADAAAFVAAVRSALEKPTRLLL